MKISTKNLLKAGPIALAMGVGSYTVYASEHIQVNNVAAGTASFDTQGPHTTIHAANNTIINYGRFDIPTAHSVQFVQPGTDARVLNRVHSMNPSVINGTLTGNGTVYLVNPAGIIFGPNSVINTHRFHAAAGNITNDHFLAGTERYTTEGGALVNNGTIHTNAGAHFIGSFVENHGAIYAPNGIVTLTAGDDVFLQQDGSSLMLRVDNVNANTGEVAATTDAPANDAGVENTGHVEANEVFFAVGDVYSLALENRGEVVAKESATLTGAGRVTTTAEIKAGDGTTGGDIAIHGRQTIVAGDLDASGSGQGGSVTVTGASVDQSAAIRANSDTGKGGGVSIDAAGDYIATSSGTIQAKGTDGGRVVVTADQRLVTSGRIGAVGTEGLGGEIILVGRSTTSLLGAAVDASGVEHGGAIYIGRADHALVNAPALKTVVTPGATLAADATGPLGWGGSVEVWSDGVTHFHGDATARGSEVGGFIEVSSAGTLHLYENARLDTAGGTILLDPKNITITDTPPGGLSIANLAFSPSSNSNLLGLSDGDGFGGSVALNDAGDLLAVGAAGDDTGGPDRGAVYLFNLDPSDITAPLTLGQKIADGTPLAGGGTLNQIEDGDRFGGAVALNGSGDILVVGAAFDHSGLPSMGSIYLFGLDTTDLSAAPQLGKKIHGQGDIFGHSAGSRFGTSVALNNAGNLLAVGMPGGDLSGIPLSRGVVTLFEIDTSDLSASTPVRKQIGFGTNLAGGGTFSLDSGDNFAGGVALNGVGDLLAVGSGNDDDGGSNRGAVYLFALDPADPSAPPTLAQKIADGTPLADGGAFALNDLDGIAEVSFNHAGDLLAVGAPLDDGGGSDRGAAYLFTLDPANPSAAPTLNQTLADGSLVGGSALSLDDSDGFGVSLALNGAGDVLVAGALRDDTNGPDRGAVYLFNLDTADLAGNPVLGQKLTDGSTLSSGGRLTLSEGSLFGWSSALNGVGDLLAVGARNDDSLGFGRGSVYLFSLDPADPAAPLVLEQRLANGSQIAGGTFTLDSNNFGTAVAFNDTGDLLAIGHEFDDTGGADASANRGAVYLFGVDPSDPASPLTQQQKIAHGSALLGATPSLSLNNNDEFGTSVALNGPGDILAVGAKRDDTGGVDDLGAAYLFTLDPQAPAGTPTLAQKLFKGAPLSGGGTLDQLAEEGFFGWSVALNGTGDALAVGSRQNGGSVYLFGLDPQDLAAPPSLGQRFTRNSPLAGGGTFVFDSNAFSQGIAFNNAGDLLAVGQPNNDTGGADAAANRGAVFLFGVDPADLGAPLELNQTIDNNTVALSDGDEFGYSVALNATGDTLAVGAQSDSTGELDSGAAYLFTLDPLSPAAPATLAQKVTGGTPLAGGSIESLTGGDLFGRSIALNGFGDILAVGSRNDESLGLGRGSIYLFSLDPLDPNSPLTLEQRLANGSPLTNGTLSLSFNTFGSAIALDNDGDVLAVGMPGNDTGGTNNGSVFLFGLDPTDLGAPLTLGQQLVTGDALANGALNLDTTDEFGTSVALNGAGDILAVGAQRDDTGGVDDLGAVYLFGVDPSDLSSPLVLGQKIASGTTLADASTLTLFEEGFFGWSTALNDAGDVLAVGARGDLIRGIGRGSVFLFNIDPLDLSAPVALGQQIAQTSPLADGTTLNLNANTFGFATALNGTGDLLAVGLPGDDTGGANRGAVYLFDLDTANLADAPNLRQVLADGSVLGGAGEFALNDRDEFGQAVALNSGNASILAVGAHRTDTGGTDVGAAYLFDLTTGADLIFDPSSGFADGPGVDSFLTPTQITNLLAGGDLTLQANNDIFVQDMIDATAGGPGDLSLLAGRSILIDADILLNGSFEAIANTPLADGVVDTHRDPGDAVITMAPGTTIDTTAAPGSFIDLVIETGLGLTHNGSGAINTQDIRASHSITLANFGGGDVLANGRLSNTEAIGIDIVGNNVTLADDIFVQALGIQQTGLLTIGPGVVINTIDGFFQVTNAPVRLDGDILTELGGAAFTGPVTLGRDVLIDTTRNSTSGGLLEMLNSVDGLTGAESLTIRTGTASAVFTSPIGSTQPLSQLSIDSAQDVVHLGGVDVGQYTIHHTGEFSFLDITATNGLSQTGPGDVTLGATLLTEGGAVSFAGPVTLGPSVQARIDTTHNAAAGAPVAFGGDLEASNGTERLDIFAGTADVSFMDIGATAQPNLIGLGIDSANDVTLDGNVFVRDLAVNNTGQLTVSGTGNNVLGVFAENGFTQTGPGPVRLDADASAVSGDILFTGPVTVGQDIEVSTGQGDITYQNTVNSLTANEHLTTGTGLGNIFFDGPVGNSQPLALLNINGTDDLTFSASVFADQLTVSNDGTFTISPGVTITATHGLTQSGFGDVRLDGDVLTESGSVTFGGFVKVGQDVSIDTTHNAAAGASVTFQSSLDGFIGSETVTIRSGTGDVGFDQGVGSIQPIAQLLINSANNVNVGNNITVGQMSVNNTGTFSTSPGVVIEATNGFSQIGTGPMQLNSTILTEGGDVTLAEPLTIFDSALIDTTHNGAAGADVSLLSTLDAPNASGFTVRAGVGDVGFGLALGGTNPLGQLLIDSANNITFGGTVDAQQVSVNHAGLFTANGTISAVNGLSQTGAGGVALNADLTTDSGDVLFTGPVTVGSSILIDTADGAGSGGGLFTALGTLDAATGSEVLTVLSINNDARFEQAVGTAQPFQRLRVDGNNIDFLNDLTVGEFELINRGVARFAPGSGLVATNGFSQAGTGGVRLDRDVLTESGDVLFQGPVTLGQNVLIDTTHNGAAGGPVTLANTLDALTGSASFTVRAGLGDVSFDQAVGALQPLSQLNVDSANDAGFNSSVFADGGISVLADGSIVVAGNLTTQGAAILLNADQDNALGGGLSITNAALSTNSGDIRLTGDGIAITESTIGDPATHNITLTADTMALGGASNTLQGTGELVFQPLNANTSIGLGDSEPGTLSLDDTELGYIADGFAGVRFGRTDGAHTLNIGELTFFDPIVFSSTVSPGEIFVNGDLIGLGDASFTFNGTGTTTTLAGDIRTVSNQVTFNDRVVLARDTTIDTTNQGASSGASVRFASGGGLAQSAGEVFNLPGPGDTPGAMRSLTLITGNGDVTFDNQVGQPAPLTLASLTIRGNNVTIRDRVFVNQMAIDNAGVFSTTPAGDITATDGLSQTGNGPVQLNSDVGTSGGGVSFAGPVTIDEDVLIDTTQNGSAGAPVTGLSAFDAVDGNEVLRIRAGGGDIRFDAPVGAQQPFGQVIIDSADDVTAGEVKTGQFTQNNGTGDTTVTDLTTDDGSFDVNTRGETRINVSEGPSPQPDAPANNTLNTSSIAQAAADTSDGDNEDAEGEEEVTDAQLAAAAALAELLGLGADQAVDPVVAFELMRRVEGFRADRIEPFTRALSQAAEAGLLQDAQRARGWLESLPADSPFRADLREVSGMVSLVENLDLPPDAALAARRVLVRQFVESDQAAEQLALILRTSDRFRVATTTP